MGRPRKTEHDDLYNEDALNHDLTPEQIREQSALLDAVEAGTPTEQDPDAEESMIEVGEREGGEYFDALQDDDSEDDQ